MDYWFTYKDTLIQFINHFFSRHKFIEDSQATILFFFEEIYFYLNYFLCFQIFNICQYKK